MHIGIHRVAPANKIVNFLPKDLNLTLVPGWEELLAADLPLADKEEEVITVDSSICLEEEVSNEQVCPVGGVVRDCKARVLNPNTNYILKYVLYLNLPAKMSWAPFSSGTWSLPTAALAECWTSPAQPRSCSFCPLHFQSWGWLLPLWRTVDM